MEENVGFMVIVIDGVVVVDGGLLWIRIVVDGQMCDYLFDCVFVLCGMLCYDSICGMYGVLLNEE